tara:strand:+ start:178 stop:1317 length:1140 start_codon:yes stop_codon:yes gene_type:complete
MNSWTYHSVIPENNKTSFGEYDNIDFLATFEGRSMNLNSVRITGDLAVRQGGDLLSATANISKDIKLDRLVGGHAFIESIQTSFFNGTNLVENLTEYPRYVKMKNAGRKDINSMNNGSNVCELLAPVDDMTNLILKGTTPPTQTTPAQAPLDPDFSIKPEFCLNNATGNPHLPYSKSGAIRITVNLARVFSALYGLDVDSTTSYSISNLKLSFSSVPEDPKHLEEKSVMRTLINLKQSIESAFANIGVKVPEICDRVSCSFQLQNQENTAKNNNTELASVKGLTEVQFLFNDSTNSLISFLLRDYEEVISRYIGSFYDTGKNVLTANNLADNDGFGIGLDFDDFIDLRNQRFSLQITSGINSQADNLLIYMYFHSVLSV